MDGWFVSHWLHLEKPGGSPLSTSSTCCTSHTGAFWELPTAVMLVICFALSVVLWPFFSRR